MLIWGSFLRTRVQGSGEFHCPVCGQQREYQLERQARVAHLYFIPLYEAEVLDQRARCLVCDTLFRSEVLYKASAEGTNGASGPPYVATITAAALDEITRRLIASQFDYGTAVRIRVVSPGCCQIEFDTPDPALDDCTDHHRDLLVLYDAATADQLRKTIIDVRNGEFVFEPDPAKD